jgi:hypothetical protein
MRSAVYNTAGSHQRSYPARRVAGNP